MTRRMGIGLAAIVWGFFLGMPGLYAETVIGEDQAPRDGMLDGSCWSSAIKQAFGTSYESYDDQNGHSYRSSTAPISKVWFTAAQGVLTEVYWPTIDTPQVKDSQFLITDGKTFFFEERRNSQTDVKWIGSGIPAFKITNRDPAGRFSIERTLFTDPDRDVVWQHIRINRFVPGLQFYILHKPTVGATPLGNSALASLVADQDAPGPGLFAWEDDHAQAIISSVPFKKVSAGFSGAPSDGWQDLHLDFKMDSSYRWAHLGNIALTGWIDIPETIGSTEFDLLLGFGQSIGEANRIANESMLLGSDAVLAKFVTQWDSYQHSIRDLSGVSGEAGRDLFRASVAILKSMEDKTFAGAFVASPTVPWGQHETDRSAQRGRGGSRNNLIGGYHLVWPRDLYQMATSFMAIEDPKSAIASLNYLKKVQFSAADGNWEFGVRRHSKDGTFSQNTWVNGEPFWAGLQMDEVSFPIVLAYRLWKANQIQLSDYWDMVRRAADFIQAFGPWSPQERWEEVYGASPSTIAIEISSLWVAAVLANEMHDTDRANRYRSTADSWSSKPNDHIENWMYTTNGFYGNGSYFLRVTGAGNPNEPWDPNGDSEFYMANGAGRWKEKAVVDGGFLELVRYGVRGPLTESIVNSVIANDATIRVNVPGKGPGFYRYVGDRYNRDDSSGRQTTGMLWPFLSGERGHYELAKALSLGRRAIDVDSAVRPYVSAMEKFATPSWMLPEQVWDGGDFAGMPTGSATPLGWTHGEYIKILRSLQDRAVFDQLIK